MIIILITILTAFVLLWHHIRPSRALRQLGDRIPGPKANPITGNIFNVLLTGKGSLEEHEKNFQEYGPVWRLWLGNVLNVFLCDPDDLQTILKDSRNITKNLQYTFLERWLNEGLLISTGGKWKLRRKAITPTFHFKLLEDFNKVISDNGNILVDTLKEQLNNDGFNIRPYLSAYALDVISETAMGVKVNAQKTKNSLFVTAVEQTTASLCDRINKVWMGVDLLYFFTDTYRREKKNVKILKDYTFLVMKNMRETRGLGHQDSSVGSKEEDEGIKKKKPFLDQMMTLQECGNEAFITDSDIEEEVTTFMFEGHDTTTSGLSFALSMLAFHPDIQEKAYAELSSLFDKNSYKATHEDLSKLSYLEMVIKEAQRLYPSVPMIGRLIDEEIKLPSGHILPKGTQLTMHMYTLHRNPKLFPNPYEFNPDNFLPDVTARRHPFSYLPFSAGPRNCIGQKFAMTEMKSALSKLLLHYKFGVKEGWKIVSTNQLVINSDSKFMLKITERK